jgi:hypothetical protein
MIASSVDRNVDQENKISSHNLANKIQFAVSPIVMTMFS